MPDYYRIRNWAQFQHYRKRNPPWVKLHFEILASQDWATLNDASRVLAVACMLLASRNGGLIPNNPGYVKRAAYLNRSPNFKPLIECGFLEIVQADASTLLADASTLQADARPETETETETETDKKESPPNGGVPSKEIHSVKSAVDLWNQLAERLGLQRVQRITEARRQIMKRRLSEVGGIEGWACYLAKIEESPFLLGKNDRGWKADFDFVTRQGKFTKILEGGYQDRKGSASDEVLQKMEEHYGEQAGDPGSGDPPHDGNLPPTVRSH